MNDARRHEQELDDDGRPGRPAPPVAGPDRGDRTAGRRRAVHRGDADQGAVVAAVGAAASYDGEDAARCCCPRTPTIPSVAARIAAGERVIAAPEPQPGERLVDAVAMMDKLRTAGPWESEQTHDSLRRYLLEETYELFDAVRSGDADELRDELGDVLLQVLFHARIAEDAPENAFAIDDVADALVRKLGNRVPAVLAGESISLEDQLAQWEERKALEKGDPRRPAWTTSRPGSPRWRWRRRCSTAPDTAGVPADLIPDGHHVGHGVRRCRRRECLALSGSGVHGRRARRRAVGRCRPACR